MAGRTPKPIQLIKGHIAKKEKKIRAEVEQSLLTGISFKEWPEVKNSPIAHKEFIRLKKLFRAIGKDDGLYESIINRYCLLLSECREFEKMKTELYSGLEDLSTQDMEFSERMDIQIRLQNEIMQCDKKVMEKRKMMLDIEKENIMTIASALRSIPKKPIEGKDTPMAAFLNRRRAGVNVS